MILRSISPGYFSPIQPEYQSFWLYHEALSYLFPILASLLIISLFLVYLQSFPLIFLAFWRFEKEEAIYGPTLFVLDHDSFIELVVLFLFVFIIYLVHWQVEMVHYREELFWFCFPFAYLLLLCSDLFQLIFASY